MNQAALYVETVVVLNVDNMILWDTVLNRLNKYNVDTRLIDIRYLNKWLKLYPTCFPKYVINNNFKIIFNSNFLRYELHRNK